MGDAEKGLTIENVRKTFEKDISVNILENIESYNDEMTISQVVRFFERHGLNFTKTMIQNYVRVGIIPPPVEKRYYIKKHLILLTMIDSLKDVYSLEEIGMLFKPIMKDVETFDDDIMDIAVVYKEFQNLYKGFVAETIEDLPASLEASAKKVDNAGVAEDDKAEAEKFISLLSLMVQTIVTKKIVKNMMNS